MRYRPGIGSTLAHTYVQLSYTHIHNNALFIAETDGGFFDRKQNAGGGIKVIELLDEINIIRPYMAIYCVSLSCTFNLKVSSTDGPMR